MSVTVDELVLENLLRRMVDEVTAKAVSDTAVEDAVRKYAGEALRRDMEPIIRRTVEDAMMKVIGDTFMRVGIDIEEPKEHQDDMQAVREWRMAMRTVKKQTLMAAVGVVITGAAGLIWAAVRSSH